MDPQSSIPLAHGLAAGEQQIVHRIDSGDFDVLRFEFEPKPSPHRQHRNRSCYQNRQYRPRECIVQRGEYSSGGLQSVK
jgi:hypothetical protein